MNNSSYEFNKGTLAIVPNGKEESLIFEDENRYIIKEKPLNIMEDSCKYFGSTFEGRKNGARNILSAEYKVPIVVEDSSNLIVFPTSSPKSCDCAWISLNRVDNIYKIDDFHTKIVFDNGKNIIVSCSYRTIENQISRASRLKIILSKRKNG